MRREFSRQNLQRNFSIEKGGVRIRHLCSFDVLGLQPDEFLLHPWDPDLLCSWFHAAGYRERLFECDSCLSILLQQPFARLPKPSAPACSRARWQLRLEPLLKPVRVDAARAGLGT